MPSDLSYWIISAPLNDGDPGLMLRDVRNALGDSVEVGQWDLPELKVCGFDLLRASSKAILEAARVIGLLLDISRSVLMSRPERCLLCSRSRTRSRS